MNLLPARLRPAAPLAASGSSGSLALFAPPAAASTAGPWLATQQLEPGVQLRLRLRPRRPAGCAEGESSPGCGWFDSSRELNQGLEVCECEVWALPAADLDAGLAVCALA